MELETAGSPYIRLEITEYTTESSKDTYIPTLQILMGLSRSRPKQTEPRSDVLKEYSSLGI